MDSLDAGWLCCRRLRYGKAMKHFVALIHFEAGDAYRVSVSNHAPAMSSPSPRFNHFDGYTTAQVAEYKNAGTLPGASWGHKAPRRGQVSREQS
jgi:hypothetical protein